MSKIIVVLLFCVHSSALFSQQLTENPHPQNDTTSFTHPYLNKDFNRTLAVPILLTAAGFSGFLSKDVRNLNMDIRGDVMYSHPNFKTTADNYLQFLPAIATFALKFGGQPSRNGMWTSTKLYVTSSILMAGSVYALKCGMKERRPDSETLNSFPSGHTATAFAGAEFMRQEFKYSAPILSYTGYLAAAATGTLRIYNNRHYLTDVLAGAGIGILATKSAYWINEKLFVKPHHKLRNQLP